MARYIDADKIEYRKCYMKNGKFVDMVYKKDIKLEPTADVQPVVHAHWMDSSHNLVHAVKCSNCKKHSETETKYCPVCGAKMDKEERSE